MAESEFLQACGHRKPKFGGTTELVARSRALNPAGPPDTECSICGQVTPYLPPLDPPTASIIQKTPPSSTSFVPSVLSAAPLSAAG